MDHILSVWCFNADDCPSFKEILHMDEELCDEWFNTMDKELQDLFKSGTFEFVSWDKVLKQGEEIVQTTKESIMLLGKSIISKHTCACMGICNVRIIQTMKHLHLWWNGQLSECSFCYQLSKDGPWPVLTSRSPLLKPPYPRQFALNFCQGMSRPIQEPRTKILKIRKSLCGDCCAANLWCHMLHKSLIKDMGFTCSEMDPCLFVKNNCIVALCVDDAIILSKENVEIERVLQQFNDLNCNFLRDKTFSSCQGIKLQNVSDRRIKLSQPHLKSSAIDIMDLRDANPCATPIASPLFKHVDSLPFDQSIIC